MRQKRDFWKACRPRKGLGGSNPPHSARFSSIDGGCENKGEGGEMRKMTQGGGVSINKEKVTDQNMLINSSMLLNDKYILAQRGKKNYFLLIAK